VKPEDVRHIVVHCSRTTVRQGDGLAVVERKCRLRGALSCGYHFVISRDGAVHSGRRLDEAGNHIVGHNADSIAICLVCMPGRATDRQRHAVQRLLDILKEQFPGATPVTHEELQPSTGKGCPGYRLKG
jgi:N-acetylmuramoyl-L-alanine amidase